MPGENVNADGASVQSKPDATEADLELALGGGTTQKAPDQPTSTTTAPDAGNPATPAPVTEQPVQAADAKTDTEAPAQTEPAKTEPAKVEEVDALAALGLEKEQVETVEQVRERLEASSREAHRLVEEQKARDKALAELGIEVVQTRKGYQLRATDKYKNELKDEDLPNVLNQLSEEERKLIDPETFKKLTKAIVTETLAKRPPVNAEAEPTVISEVEIAQVFNQLSEAKLGDKPLYPGFTEADVLDTMKRIYQSPSSSDFTQWMNRSQANYGFGLRMLYNSAWRVIAPVRARQAAERAKAQQDKEKNGKAGSVTSSGGGVRVDATSTTGKPETLAQKIAREIATAT